MTISVYDTIMPAEPVEVYDDHGLTVEDWIRAKTPSYRRGEVQPLSCSINGAIVKPLDWHDAWISEKDNVEFRVVPRGDALDFVFPFWAGTVNVAVNQAFSYLLPDIPGQGGQGQRGSQLEPADARANTARLGQAVPELFGRYIRYPDYLNQPRKYYKDTRTQVLNLMLSVGVGEYIINDSEVLIGETPISEIQGASYTIFQPGVSVSGVENHENWFSAPEVGSTSSSAGIRLKGVTYDERTYFGGGTASGDTIVGINVGELWTVGISGQIKMDQPVTVVDGGASADIFQGNFQHLDAGITVNVESNVNVNGTYVVSTINGAKTEITLETTGGDPVEDATAGSGTISIDKAGTKYVVLDIFGDFQIDVQRILSGGGNDPDWDGNLPQDSLSLSIIWDANTFTANRAGPFFACPEGETTDTIEVDIFASQGLGVIDGESIDPRSRTIRIEWRESGALSWNSQSETVSGNTRDQLGWTFTVNLPSKIRPEVRVSRVGGEDVSVTSLDRLEFTALRSKLETVTSYPDVTTMAVTIEGSDEISAQSNNRINLIAHRKLPVISGGSLTSPTQTRAISAAAAYVAKSLGYEDDQIDLDRLEQLEDIWTPRGDYFDYVFSDGTAKAAIDTILRAGFAEMTLQEGVITPVRDQVRTTLEQGYSPENMTGPLQRQFQAKQVDEPDGVEVEYIDGSTWTTETVNCFLSGDQGIKLDKVKIDGVTDRTRAWRIGMRRRRAQRYRRWTYSFNTELDALNSQYLSYVPLLDDIPGYGKVAILESISSDRITVSEPLEFEAGKTHVIAYREADGTTVGPFTANQGPDQYTVLVSIPQPWPSVLPSNQEPTHVYFGTTERWNFPALITEITPNGPLSASVAAVNYDERVYSDDNNAP
jgi:hypothetical protein